MQQADVRSLTLLPRYETLIAHEEWTCASRQPARPARWYPRKGHVAAGQPKVIWRSPNLRGKRMKMKYNILLLSYRRASIQHLIRQQRLHLMDCATLTNTHPGRLCHMSAPNPTWPPSAQRSFNAAMKIDIYLKGFFTDRMNLPRCSDRSQTVPRRGQQPKPNAKVAALVVARGLWAGN